MERNKNNEGAFGKYSKAVELGSWALTLAGGAYIFNTLPGIDEQIATPLEVITPAVVMLGTFTTGVVAGALTGERTVKKS